MKVLIEGAYGYNNIGDESMLFVLTQSISKNLSNSEITIVSHNISQTQKLHNINSTKSISPFFFLKKLLSADFDAAKQLIKNLRTTDIYIIGGGSLINDNKGYQRLLSLLLKILLLKIFGSKIVFWGISIGPLNSGLGKALSKLIISSSDIICVRDSSSATFIKDHAHHHNGVDLVFGLPQFSRPSFPSPQRPHKPLRIGLSLRPFPPIIGSNADKNDELIATTVARALKRLSKKFPLTIIPQPFCGGHERNEDLIIINKVKEYCEGVTFEEPEYRIHPTGNNATFSTMTASLLQQYKKLDLIIGMRFHSLIYSTISSIPFVALSYDPKISQYCKSSNMDNNCIDLTNIAQLDTYELANAIVKAATTTITNYQHYSSQINKLSNNYCQQWKRDESFVFNNISSQTR